VRKRGSSKRWLAEHHADPFVQAARAKGYRSRAAFKLIEIHERDRLFVPGMTVLDLGAAPGGWSQVAVEFVGDAGRVVATDILAMDPIPGVEFVRGDFTEAAVEAQVRARFGESDTADLVISDMAPNLSGIRATDEARSALLAELASDMAAAVLAPGGGFLCKVFHGGDTERLIKDLRAAYRKVSTRKPKSSRARSSEFYVLAQGFGL